MTDPQVRLRDHPEDRIRRDRLLAIAADAIVAIAHFAKRKVTRRIGKFGDKCSRFAFRSRRGVARECSR